MNKIIEFKAVPEKAVYKSDGFKIYGCSIDKFEYKEVKTNKYNMVTIKGDIQDLSLGVEYLIKAEEVSDKYGDSYLVKNISREVPKTLDETRNFLYEILTKNQTDTLLKVYPNIVDKVKNNDLNDIDLNKLKGIKEKTFEKIKNKVTENFCLFDVISEFSGLLTMSMVKKLYECYTSVDVLKQKLKDSPYITLTQISRVGFKTADNLIIKMYEDDIIDFGYDIKTSKDRCLACILHLLGENESNGNTLMNIVELRTEVLKTAPECIDEFTNAIKDDSIYYDKDTLDIALKKTYDTEVFIKDTVVSYVSNKDNVWDFNIEKYKRVGEFDLSDEQLGLLDSVCKNNFTILTAPAGSGKSFSTKALINLLEDNNKSYILCCPTGKSSKKLSEYTGRESNTIHRTLGYTPQGFMYNEENKLVTDVILLDEVGMTDIFLFANLLKALEKNTKIVLIGDMFQLNSCGAGCVLRDLAESGVVPRVTFNKIFRLGKGGALTACTYVRQNNKFITKNEITFLGEDKSYAFIPCNKNNINDMVIALYKKLLLSNDPSDITVISSFNIGENGCDKLNRLLQPIANKNATIDNNNYITITSNKNEVKYYVGDNVLQNSNNYHALVYNDNNYDEPEEVFIPNGTQGTIKSIDTRNKTMIIDFDGTIIIYKQQDLPNIRHSFALSTHKMQGSQNKIIIFCCPSSHIYFLNNNLVYTALSRAEKNIYHFSDVKTLNIAMNKSDNKKRETFLCDLLKECNDVVYE